MDVIIERYNSELTGNEKESTVQEILKTSVDQENPIRKESSKKSHFSKVSEVTENLLLCSALAVQTSTFSKLSVSCVINAASELPFSPLYGDGIIYYKVAVDDSVNSDLSSHFDHVADLIQAVADSGHKTLVHCVAGISRSASLCLAYLMKYQKLTLLEAYNYLKLKRPVIRPNCGFFRQLIEYETKLFGRNSVAMVFNDILLMEIPEVYDSEYKDINLYRNKCRDNGGRH